MTAAANNANDLHNYFYGQLYRGELLGKTISASRYDKLLCQQPVLDRPSVFISDNPLHEFGINMAGVQTVIVDKGILPGWHKRLVSVHNNKDNFHSEIYGNGKINIAYQSGIVISSTRRHRLCNQIASDQNG